MKFRIVVALTVMAAGRAMTIPYIGRAGDGGAGDPPEQWLMPLIGDAAVGVAAIAIAVLLVVRPSPVVWVSAVVWNAIAAFDALAAFVVDTTAPWGSFFMLEAFGRPMFFAAAALHVVLIALLSGRDMRDRFGVQPATVTEL